MKRSSPLALFVLLSAACSSSAPIPVSPGEASGYFHVGVTGYDALGRTLGSSTGIWIELEEEAHVAVFEIRDVQGAILLWPYSEESPRTMPTGRTDLPALNIAEERIARWRRSYLNGEPRVVIRGSAPPGLVLVVASSRPLAIDAYLEDHRRLVGDMGGDFDDLTRAVTRILNLLVANPQGHNWGWTCSGTPMWCRGRR